ncbi:putative porin [Zunongwangia sp. HGR-M22]|uniref:putative porin n=1 Tax=Zunongwangia sp. HGR-M22 TaxID=3015168 RepID=UPI0022DE3709|nr:putative porin [Zunongwangia sp. HGR-M22]WBL26129.1 putative porin [Zunongwangia sp. HGR-M22]
MKKVLLLITIFNFSFFCHAQEQKLPNRGAKGEAKDSVAEPTIDLFKIISVENDTTQVDTSLTIQKDYKFNYLRKDLFGLLPFANTGQTYNALTEFRDFNTIKPKFGARARHYNFMEPQDINYYHVPTPLTELYFKTVPEQGQQLDAFFTVNTSERLNFSVAYKGVRALGKFRHMLTSTGNFRTTLNYQTKDRKYRAKAHFVSQDLMNEENGGLTDDALQSYVSKEEEFEDRSVLDVNFENAESTLYGKGFFLYHQYYLNGAQDSIDNKLYFSHRLDYSYKKFQYLQSNAANSFFGSSFQSTGLRDEVRYENFSNTVAVNFDNSVLGKISGRAGFSSLDYWYESVFVGEDGVVGDRLDGQLLEVGGSYDNYLGGFNLHGDIAFTFGDNFSGNHIIASAGYQIDPFNFLNFGLKQTSRAPNLNFLLYQSNYINYNWQHAYDNENAQSLFFELSAKRIANFSGEITQIQNYTYFGRNGEGAIKPFQSGSDVRYVKLKAQREFRFGKFALDNTILYQKVSDGGDVFNVPELLTRNSLYYKDFWFDKALYLQTGFTFNYFSSYQMDGYDPVLAEFYVQNESNYGAYPLVDFFFNGKVDQARIFFKLENLNFALNGNNNFSAPRYPHNDFMIRFGIVWNFFL